MKEQIQEIITQLTADGLTFFEIMQTLNALGFETELNTIDTHFDDTGLYTIMLQLYVNYYIIDITIPR